MKILVVSGFLGAGKTTFIQALAKGSGKEFVILENEYGEVGIDGKLFEEEKKEDTIINIWELTEGCVCCSIKADFASSVLTIANTLDPEYLVVEPTGVGQLSRIIDNLRQLEYEHIQLLAPITVLDGRLWQRYLTDYRDIYIDQIAMAGTVVVSHCEGFSPQEQETLQRIVRQHNDSAQVLTTHYTKQEKSWWKGLVERSIDGNILPPTSIDLDGLENLGLTDIKLPTELDLILFLEGVIRRQFGKIIRAKGFLQIGQNWIRFDVVDTNYTLTGIAPQEDTRGVFIGENLQRNQIRKVLQSHMVRRITLKRRPSK